MTEEHEFMTVTQIADALGLHKNTILKLIGDGRMKAVTVGGRWLIRKTELEMVKVIREEGTTRPTIYRLDAAEAAADAEDAEPPRKKRRGKKAA